VHQPQQRDTVAGIQYCHWFRRSVRERDTLYIWAYIRSMVLKMLIFSLVRPHFYFPITDTPSKVQQRVSGKFNTNLPEGEQKMHFTLPHSHRGLWNTYSTVSPRAFLSSFKASSWNGSRKACYISTSNWFRCHFTAFFSVNAGLPIRYSRHVPRGAPISRDPGVPPQQ
jgi:hypothetical protein